MVRPLFDLCVKYHQCRYTDFKDLFDKIKMNYPSEAKQLNFPWQLHVVGNFNPGFIKQRRIGLHKFIVNAMKVCCSVHQQTVGSLYVRY